jgi:ketosteroid isomerase-like protein
LSNQEIVLGMFDSFQQRDHEWAFRYYAEDIEWDARVDRLPLDIRGVYRGHEGVREYWRQWLPAWREVDSELNEVIPVGADAVITTMRVLFRGRGSGIGTHSDWAWLWRFRDGKVTRVSFHETKEDALAAVERE